MKALLILTLALLVSACNPAVNSVTLYLGDSLLAMSAESVVKEALNEDETGTTLPVYNAISGMGTIRHTEYIVGRLGNIQDRMALDYVVISLGTNDMGYKVDGVLVSEDQMAYSALQILNALDHSTVVFWVYPHHSGKAGDARLDAIKAGIDQAVRYSSNHHAVSFNDFVEAKGLSMFEMMRSEVDLHFSVAGAVQYADFVNKLIGE